MKHFTIYTDGACSNNPGPGGYGVVITNHKNFVKELSGSYKLTTNNRMELMAVIKGLEFFKEPSKIIVCSDSKYIIDAVNQGWLDRWNNNNWYRNGRDIVKNKDLWKSLLGVLHGHSVKFVWIKGHSGDKLNERCDKLAVSAIHNLDQVIDCGYKRKE